MISFKGLLNVIAGTRHSGEQLREIRAKKGVGRPARSAYKMGAWKVYPALMVSHYEVESPNYAEWQRKPRRKDRGPAA